MTLASFKQSGNIPVSKNLFMQLANTENVNLHYFKIFISISPPTDLLLLKSLITCFMSFTETCLNKNLVVILKFCLIVLMLGWFIPPSLAYDRRMLEEPSVHICRSVHICSKWRALHKYVHQRGKFLTWHTWKNLL